MRDGILVMILAGGCDLVFGLEPRDAPIDAPPDTADDAHVPCADWFRPKETYPTPTAPISMSSGQFDGDGLPDLMVAADTPPTIALFTSTTPGMFSPAPQLLSTLSTPRGVVMADFDSDGRLDYAVVSQASAAVRAYFNTGTGVQTVDLPVGVMPVALAVGKLNADDALDLVTANQGEDSVSVALGDATLRFLFPVPVGSGDQPTALVLADLDDDGDLDLAVANRGSNNVTTRLNSGGTLSGGGTFAVGTGPVAIAAGHLNGDRFPDLAVANASSGTVTLLIASGVAFAETALVVGTTPRAVQIADLDRDGHDDLVVALGGDKRVAIYRGDGQGVLIRAAEVMTSGDPVAVVVEDFDRDGILDLAIGNAMTSKVDVVRGCR